MEMYFFIAITLIIIALLLFACSESSGRNSPKARGKKPIVQHASESAIQNEQNSNELHTVQSNH